MFKPRGRIIPVLALATAGCLWGTGFYFGKIALTEMPVASMVLFRFAFVCAGLLPIIFFDRTHFVRNEWGWVFAASLLGVPVQYLVQYKGLSLTTVSHASLMVGTLPMLLAIASVAFAGERLHFGGWLALAGSTCGAALIALSSNQLSGVGHASTSGDLLVVLSMFAAIAWILISKLLMRRHPQ
jgi:drug/metabolite transporter (DMT)-like permease